MRGFLPPFYGFASFVLLVSFAYSAHATTYTLKDNSVGPSFYNDFIYEAIPDPTNGRVNYVDQATAVAQNLTFASSDTFILRTDFTTVLSPTGPGRNSVRIRSVNNYTTHVVMVEGVNDVSPNGITIWTGASCSMPANRNMTGTPEGTDCDFYTTGDQNGCGVLNPTLNSYGPAFNSNGGGWYAMERTNTFIKVWFWDRQSTSVPTNVETSGSTVDTSGWGIPTALYPNTDCNIKSRFGPNYIIINLTLCGDWAGDQTEFSNDGCPGTCVDYVNNNPQDFVNAFWDFASVRVYT